MGYPKKASSIHTHILDCKVHTTKDCVLDMDEDSCPTNLKGFEVSALYWSDVRHWDNSNDLKYHSGPRECGHNHYALGMLEDKAGNSFMFWYHQESEYTRDYEIVIFEREAA